MIVSPMKTFYMIDRFEISVGRREPLLISECAAMVTATIQPGDHLRTHNSSVRGEWSMIEPSSVFCSRLFLKASHFNA